MHDFMLNIMLKDIPMVYNLNKYIEIEIDDRLINQP